MSEAPHDAADEAARDAYHNEKMRKKQAAREKIMAGKTIERGLVIVHTGKGKGKSTAAFGMACRMIGHGHKVAIIQFIKGAMETGEKVVFDAFPDQVEFRAMGEGFTWDTQDRARDVAVAGEAWAVARERILDSDIGMVICDELNVALRYDYVPLAEVLEVLAARPEGKHVVITGRNAAPELIEVADLATEMELLKHPFRSGVKAQPGIEF